MDARSFWSLARNVGALRYMKGNRTLMKDFSEKDIELTADVVMRGTKSVG